MMTIDIPNPNAVKLPPVNLPGSEENTTELETQQETTVPDAEQTAQPQAVEATSKTSSNNTSSLVAEALNSGYSIDEVKTYLVQTKGMSDDDADLNIVSGVKSKVLEAKQANYSDEEIASHLTEKGYDANTIDKVLKASKLDDKYKSLDYKNSDLSEQDKAMEISDLYSNIYSKYSTLGKTVYGSLFNEDTAIEARREINQLNFSIVSKLKSSGIDSFIDPENGEVMMRDSNGLVTEVDSSFLAGLYNSGGEAIGGFGGAIAGGRIGAAGYAAGPLIGTATTAIGAGIGGALGAMSGRAYDLTVNAKKLSENLSSDLYMSQIAQAGAADAVFSVLGSSVWQLGKAGKKALYKSVDYVRHGNPNGAYKALKDNLNITDDQAADMVANFEKLNDTEAAGKTFQQKAINVISQTGQGAETAVRQAAAQNERIATVFKQSIDARAKGVQEAVKTVTDNNIGSFVRKDLKAYQDDVKDFYGAIKQQGAEAINGTDFRFDLDKITIQPVMKNIEKNLSDPIKREQFIGYANRIEAASEDRTFGGLLEMRSIVNDFKYSKTLNYKDTEAINTVINKIDGQIGTAVKDYMPETGKAWMENFSKAKSEYSKMKVLQENKLFEAIHSKGVTENGIRSALNKYGNTLDVNAEIFNPLVERLSPATRVKVEGAAIKNLVDKHTIGKATEYQAINFPELAEQLKTLSVKMPNTKNLVNVINDIAKVYKNDQELASLAGRTTAKAMTNTLATRLDLVVKVGLIRASYNAIAKYMPGQSARNLALISQVSKLLKNPLHARTADELLKQIPSESLPEMKSLIRELQIETAKKGTPEATRTVPMYKQSKSGKLVTTDGALGKGIYLTDKISNPTMVNKVAKHDVDVTRMATLDNISSLLGRDITEKEIRNIPGIQQQLADKGYLGIKLGNKAMLFPDKIIDDREIIKLASSKELDQFGNKVKKGLIDKEAIVYHGGPELIKANDFKPGFSNRVYFGISKGDASNYAGETGKIGAYSTKGKFIDVYSKDFIDFTKKLFNNKLPDGEDSWEDVVSMMHTNPGYFSNLKNEDIITEKVNDFARSKKADGFWDSLLGKTGEMSILPERVKHVLKDEVKKK